MKFRSVLLIFCSLAVGPTAQRSRAAEFVVADQQELTDTMLRIRATQFLQRATFGAKPNEVDQLAARMAEIGVVDAASEWIDRQLALPPTKHLPLVRKMLADDGHDVTTHPRTAEVTDYKDFAWWHASLTAPDQLKQRIAWALAQIFVVNDDPIHFRRRFPDVDGSAYWMSLPRYYDLFLDAPGGTYRDLLGKVTFDPAMGVFLNHAYNKAGDAEKGHFADENYAREILQLFSIGRFELDLDGKLSDALNGPPTPAYDNKTIQEFARLFTGFVLQPVVVKGRQKGSMNLPMTIETDRHDRGNKTLLNGLVLPSDGDPVEEINAGLDNIATHKNVAPFISRLLIQRLVSSNPTKKYVVEISRVFRDNGEGVRGDLSAVVKAILLHREAWGSISIRNRTRPLRLVVKQSRYPRSRMNEPLLGALSLIRRFGSSDYPTGRFMFCNQHDLRQGPYSSPTVFNYYLPDFQSPGLIANARPNGWYAGGQLYSPELQLMHADGMVSLFNWFHEVIQDAGGRFDVNRKEPQGNPNRSMKLSLDFSVEESLADDPEALVEHLDLTLCAGTMSPKAREIFIEAVRGSNHPDEAQRRTDRARGALMALYTSPAFWILN